MTENKDRLALANHISVQHEFITRMDPEGVWKQLYPLSPDYGFKSPALFRKSAERSIEKHERPAVFVFLAGPNEGKTHAKEGLAAALKKPGRRISRLEKKTGESFEFDEINWGDVISVAKIQGLIDPDTKFGGLQIPKDTDSATFVFEQETARTLQENQGKRRGLFLELPISGAWIDGLVGIDRGLTTLWHLARHKKVFKGLDYDTYFVGLVAHPQIADYALEIRSRITDPQRSTAEVIDMLKERGETVLSQGVDRIGRYAHESPNLAAIRMFREKEEELAREMAKAGKFPLGIDFPLDREYRARIIGEVLKVILRDSVRASSGRVYIGYNREFVPERGFGTTPINNILWQRHPEIAQVVNK